MGFSIAILKFEVALNILIECLLKAFNRVSCLIPNLTSLSISLTTYLTSRAVHKENNLFKCTLLVSDVASHIRSRYLFTSWTSNDASDLHRLCSRICYRIWGKSPVMSCRVWNDWSLKFLSRSSSVLGSVNTSLMCFVSWNSFMF